MREIPDDTLFDQRLIDRHIAEGLITRQQVDDRLKKLTDTAAQGETLDISELSAGGRPIGDTPVS